MGSFTISENLLQVPLGLQIAAGEIANFTDALETIDTGDSDIEPISYEDIERVPEIIGPLIDTAVERSGPLLTENEIFGASLYDGLEGSGFEAQRSFLQGLVERQPPPITSLDRMMEELEARNEVADESVEHGTISFLKGLQAEGKIAIESFRNASMAFNISELKSASAICDYLDARSSSESMSGKYGANILDLIEAGTAASFFDALEEDPDETLLGPLYLYGLHYGSHSPTSDFFLTRLFRRSGSAHELMGKTDAAVRAYAASVLFFSKIIQVPPLFYRQAIASLDRIAKLDPKIAPLAISTMGLFIQY